MGRVLEARGGAHSWTSRWLITASGGSVSCSRVPHLSNFCLQLGFDLRTLCFPNQSPTDWATTALKVTGEEGVTGEGHQDRQAGVLTWEVTDGTSDRRKTNQSKMKIKKSILQNLIRFVLSHKHGPMWLQQH